MRKSGCKAGSVRIVILGAHNLLAGGLSSEVVVVQNTENMSRIITYIAFKYYLRYLFVFAVRVTCVT